MTHNQNDWCGWCVLAVPSGGDDDALMDVQEGDRPGRTPGVTGSEARDGYRWEYRPKTAA
jgi:hypothetical protein